MEAGDHLESESDMLPFALDSEGICGPAPAEGGSGRGGAGGGGSLAEAADWALSGGGSTCSRGGDSSGGGAGPGVSQLLATGYAVGGDRDARVGAFIHMLQEAPALASCRPGQAADAEGSEGAASALAAAWDDVEQLTAKLVPLLHVPAV